MDVRALELAESAMTIARPGSISRVPSRQAHDPRASCCGDEVIRDHCGSHDSASRPEVFRQVVRAVVAKWAIRGEPRRLRAFK